MVSAHGATWLNTCMCTHTRAQDVIIKTLILAHPHLLHSYTVCRPGRGPDERSQFFEVLGFDIMLDHNLRPWLLEVNRSPSFGTDAPLDLQIKTGVIRDALRLANIRCVCVCVCVWVCVCGWVCGRGGVNTCL